MAHASDADAVAFLQWAVPRLGLRWAGFRNVRGTVRKRLVRRMTELGLDHLGDYRARLEADAAEWDALATMCRIPISRLYRDRAVYDVLAKEILPERASVETNAVRVWSAGCASGEEPYTIALIWHLAIAPAHPRIALDLVATDIDETMIARAERGIYEAGSLRELPPDLRDRGLERVDGDFRVPDAIRQGVTFRREDMRATMPDGPFDVILCRNSAFTYFDEAVQRDVADRLVARLAPGGALVVGSHEHVPEMPLRLRAPCVYERRT